MVHETAEEGRHEYHEEPTRASQLSRVEALSGDPQCLVSVEGEALSVAALMDLVASGSAEDLVSALERVKHASVVHGILEQTIAIALQESSPTAPTY